MSVEKLSPTASYGALDRKVRALRDAVSAYDKETADRKRVAERSGGPAARFVVDQMRAPGFHKLRERLRKAELELASWKPRKKKPIKDDRPFSAMMKDVLKRPTLPNTQEGRDL